MKNIIIALTVLLVLAGDTLGLALSLFSGWDKVKRHSSDIIIARCVKTVDGPREGHGLLFSDLEVLSSLKGRTNLGPARLDSLFWPRQGEHYLIFANYHDAFYQAVETYRIVPLGTYIPPDLLTGKTSDENIRILFRRRLEDLDRQMKEDQEEKQRLEEGLKEKRP